MHIDIDIKFKNTINLTILIRNTYKIKKMSKIYIHMIRILNVFRIDENYNFDYKFKSINYKKIRAFKY